MEFGIGDKETDDNSDIVTRTVLTAIAPMAKKTLLVSEVARQYEIEC